LLYKETLHGRMAKCYKLYSKRGNEMPGPEDFKEIFTTAASYFGARIDVGPRTGRPQDGPAYLEHRGLTDQGHFGIVGWLVRTSQPSVDDETWKRARMGGPGGMGHEAFVPGPHNPVEHSMTIRLRDRRYERPNSLWELHASSTEQSDGDGLVRARIHVPDMSGASADERRDTTYAHDSIGQMDIPRLDELDLEIDFERADYWLENRPELGDLAVQGLGILIEGLRTGNFYPASRFLDRAPYRTTAIVV
jgi:hypothetical protein